MSYTLRLKPCLYLLPRIAGVVVIVLGVSVLAGWLTENAALVQVRPDQAPVQGNVAVGFLFCGIALLGVHLNWRRLPNLLGAGVALFAALTLSQYLLNVDLGIDQWLFDHTITTHTSHPGRMAPNTAVAFVASGVALMLLRYLPFIGALLGSLVFTLGAAALLGYVIGIPNVFAWGSLTHMAVLTALGFSILGLGFVTSALQQHLREAQPGLQWTPLLVGATMAFAGILLWHGLRSWEAQQIHEIVETTAQGVHGEIIAQIDLRTTTLLLLAQHGATLGWRSPEDWHPHAQIAFGPLPDLRAIEWINPEGEARVIATSQNKPHRLANTPRAMTLLQEALKFARMTQRPAITGFSVVVGPFFFQDGESAFRVLVPVPQSGPPEHYLSGVFLANETFTKHLEGIAAGYDVTVLCRNRTVFNRGDALITEGGPWVHVRSLDLPGNLPWQVAIAPQDDVLALHRTALPEVVLGASLIIALLLGSTIRFGERATRRSELFEAAVEERTTELEQENAERRRSENILRRVQSVNQIISAELDLKTVIQTVTDAATELTGAAFGAFFFNHVDEHSKSYDLYALSGAAQKAFRELPMPCNTPLFALTFCGEDVIRLDDVTKDPRYGNNPPLKGLPKAHSRVRSYMAAPVISRSRQVLGGLFLGHPEPGKFNEHTEQILVGIASQAAIAIDNARLFQEAQREITERKKAEETLRQKTEQLAEMDRRKDVFLAMLGHELRNPLGSVRNALEALSLHPGDAAVDAHMRGIVQRQVGHLTRLVDDLLDVSRIKRGKLAVRAQRIDLIRLVNEAVESDRASIQAKDLSLEVNLPAEPLWVDADPTRLTQVIDNLLSNAKKYTDAGGKISVAVVGDPEFNRATVSIRDTGCGIHPYDRVNLFDPFMRSDEVSHQQGGGLGLGLSIAIGLIETHGGQIEVYSEGEGQGSEFVFHLPLQELQQVAPQNVKNVQKTESDGTAQQRILVIDDQHDSADALGELLTLYGYQAEVVYDGPSALEAARRFRPDTVICDIGLPEMDGYQIAEQLRADPRTASIRLFALTGYGDHIAGRRARETGFDHYLTKPVDLSRLRGLLTASPSLSEA